MQKRILAFLLTALLALSLLGCGEVDLKFKNETGTTLDNVYLSAVSQDAWGDPVSHARISNGNSIVFDFKDFGGEPGIYDFGAINSDGRSFDVYDVPLAVGDELTLGPEIAGDPATTTLTVKHRDGSVDTYTGYCFFESELLGEGA